MSLKCVSQLYASPSFPNSKPSTIRVIREELLLFGDEEGAGAVGLEDGDVGVVAGVVAADGQVVIDSGGEEVIICCGGDACVSKGNVDGRVGVQADNLRCVIKCGGVARG